MINVKQLSELGLQSYKVGLTLHISTNQNEVRRALLESEGSRLFLVVLVSQRDTLSIG